LGKEKKYVERERGEGTPIPTKLHKNCNNRQRQIICFLLLEMSFKKVLSSAVLKQQQQQGPGSLCSKTQPNG
jgi:hypothetical protein